MTMNNKKLKAARMHHKHKTIHFVRHAEGSHNVEGEVDYKCYLKEEHEDANLSELGNEQCRQFNIKSCDEGIGATAELLVVSPMRRTLQTAQRCFSHLQQAMPWVACELVREQTGLHPCDRRRTVTEYETDYPHIDFSQLDSNEDPLFFQYQGREPDEIVAQRGRDFMEWLAKRPEREIIVVTHSAYLRHLLGSVLDLEEGERTKFYNCEVRTYAISL
jgi:broad specificity phosphatase PhoE